MQLQLAYGTLLSKESLAKTLQQPAETIHYIPVIIKGFRRIYNYSPPSYRGYTAANIKKQKIYHFDKFGKPQIDYLNALAFPITEAQVKLLRDREYGYTRIKIPIYDFYHPDTLIGEAFAFVVPIEHTNILSSEGHNSVFLPQPIDIKLARNASYGISDKFGHIFDKTSYLSDNKHTLQDIINHQ